jgi:hypothetical protein
MLKPLLAAAGGAVVGFYIAKLRYEKAAYAYATERIEEVKIYAEERADRKIRESRAEAEIEKVAEVAAIFEKEDHPVEEVLQNPVVEGLIRNYQSFSTPAPPTVDNEDEEDSESYIVLIRRKEFFEGPADVTYDQTAVTYYANDDILIDAHDKQLDVKAAIGSIRPDWFGNEADDENVCYVRNTKLKIEFEVNRSQASYARDVLGIGVGDEKSE